MKIFNHFTLITLFQLCPLMLTIAQKDNLRRDDKYYDTGLPNNCDKVLYAVSQRGAIINLGTHDNLVEHLVIEALLPFRCNAIAKSLNNKIFAVQADKSTEQIVYEYNSIAKNGKFTKWVLPAHDDGGWISAGTDTKGKLYFGTTTMRTMVRIDLRKKEVDVIWGSKDKIKGGERMTCYDGCNFYINERDEIMIKENKKNSSYRISQYPSLVLTEQKKWNNQFNNIVCNDWYEYRNTKDEAVSIFATRDGIVQINDNRLKHIQLDTLKYGILTDIAGCESYERRSPYIVINEKKEKLILEAIAKKENIRLDRILFKQGESKILTGSYDELDELVAILQKNKQIKIVLEGHTDISGNPEDNVLLSLERVNACKDYLILQGIDKSRLQVMGYGGSRPIKKFGTEEERAINRRVEIKVIE